MPGEYLAADPKGRACLIGAVEKQKFVYVLNRDNEANLTISSPLEAHKSHNIVFRWGTRGFGAAGIFSCCVLRACGWVGALVAQNRFRGAGWGCVGVGGGGGGGYLVF